MVGTKKGITMNQKDNQKLKTSTTGHIIKTSKNNSVLAQKIKKASKKILKKNYKLYKDLENK